MVEPWYETAFGPAYPFIYGHRDRAEAARCVAVLESLAPLAGPVLDLGCGEGRHLPLLAAGGRVCVGIDLSAALLQRARASDGGGDLSLLRADMRTIPLAAGTCGTVVSLFTAFGYFVESGGNAAVVDEVARVLAPGGHWCLDLFDGDRVRAELGDGRPRPRERRAGALIVREERRYDAVRRVVSKGVRVEPAPGRAEEAATLGLPAGGLAYTEEVVVHTLDELDGMAAGAGLGRVAAAGGYGGQPLGGGDRWLLVYRKEGSVAAREARP